MIARLRHSTGYLDITGPYKCTELAFEPLERMQVNLAFFFAGFLEKQVTDGHKSAGFLVVNVQMQGVPGGLLLGIGEGFTQLKDHCLLLLLLIRFEHSDFEVRDKQHESEHRIVNGLRVLTSSEHCAPLGLDFVEFESFQLLSFLYLHFLHINSDWLCWFSWC